MHDAKDRQKFAIWAQLHNWSGYIFATKAHIDNLKKLLNSNTSFTCPHNMANFGSLTAEIGSLVWGTPANFNGNQSTRHTVTSYCDKLTVVSDGVVTS